MYFQLGWRNIWRNPRRTCVIMAAVVIGVWSMIFLGSLMRGIADQMVRNGIATLTGHIQIYREGYQSDPVIENSLQHPHTIESVLNHMLPPDSHWAPRVRVNSIVSNARHSDGVTLVGIDPDREARVSFIKGAMVDGRYLEEDDRYGIVVGKALVDKFETEIGRKMVVMSQDAGGEIASRAFRIVGIFRAEMEATEKRLVFVTLPAAQNMLELNDELSEISILLKSRQEVEPVAEALRGLMPEGIEVQTWQQLLPTVTAILRMYDGFIFLWFLVVFVAMGFGIVNTTLMAVFERVREFGLLKALGMKPRSIVLEVLTESFFILLIGMAIGNSLGFLTVKTLSEHGIDLSSLSAGLEYVGMARVVYPVLLPRDVATANLVVFALGLLVSLYPAIKAARFTPVEAMAHT